MRAPTKDLEGTRLARTEDLNTQEELTAELKRFLAEDDLPMTEKIWRTIRGYWHDVPFSVVLGMYLLLEMLPTMLIAAFAALVFVYEDHHGQPISRLRRLKRKIDALVRRKRELGLPTGPPSHEKRADQAED